MYLLQIGDDNDFSLVEFASNSAPRYAILSHTWGSDDEEVTFQDMKHGTGNSKIGYRKILFCGKQAASDGIQHFWVDSCCIDKTNSQQLQEAINSMFRWYQNAARCYVYLSDVSDGISSRDNEPSRSWKLEFRRSRWFTRGWTLQELIAPSTVEFFSREGTCLGNKQSLETTIHEITEIALEALRGPSLSQFSKDERLAWAAKRETQREEDAAYCLLGIFGVFMPLIYGEGRESAMTRLEEHIDKTLKEPLLSLDKEQKRMLINSLRFEQMDARHLTIKKAHSKTCEWLLKKSEFLDWLDTDKLNEHHGFLWIRGKPGTGKSTLMKYALAHARKTMKGKVVISFFFNARGADIEKSTIGTYRSLLLQLLERLPTLQRVFNSLEISQSSIGPNYEWSIGALETALEQAIMLLRDCSLVCFIDALDECDEQQIREMIRFFERVGELAVLAGIGFQICFSSRHYPNITIRNGISLVLEGQEGHNQDISNYLESELKIGRNEVAQQIRSELQEKATGVFMWVVLVVDILNKEYDRGRIHALRRRLHDIPGDLHELFRDILTRDSHNKEDLVLCIQWVLFARHPLNLEQLYFAILSGVDPEAVSSWNQDEVTQDVMRRFILDCSKGFTEITTSKLQKDRKVQFIHESVRDFLLKEEGLGNIWPDLRSNFYGQSHERLKQCCLNYIKVDAISLLELPVTFPRDLKRKAAALRKSAIENFPFLDYAAQNVLCHADVAEGSDITQVDFLDAFPLPQWVKLTNLLEKHKARRHTEQVSLLYVLAEFNMANLLRARSPGPLCLEIGEERYGCAFLAAAATRSKDALRVCMESLEVHQSTCSNDRRRQEQRHAKDVEALVGLGRQWEYSGKRGLLSYAAELGQATMAAYLIDQRNLDLDAEDPNGQTPLWLAIQNENDAVVELLLSTKKVDINKTNRDNKTPLYHAAENGSELVVQMLLDAGANVRAQGGNLGNALQAASSVGSEAVIRLLIDAGADVNAQGGHFDNALQAASCIQGSEAVVRLLLDAGANVHAQGGYYGNALQAASYKGSEAVVWLLLAAGADVNAKGGEYGNALQAASREGSKAIVRLLIVAGADVNAKGGSFGNALQAASSNGNEAVVRLLLHAGADVNAKGGYFDNALQAASAKGSFAVVWLLLSAGADVNAWSNNSAYSSALQAAEARGHETVARLLRYQGAVA
ncbi:hypothetical protein FB567DRAFT_523733 [Paraphoma chrysanthemicola]|uniref:Heterokaryon incompatibility domain-containing protein n=1 Tax=Paraphoma chrysanthemicola TaxID=798071 RepID=A0A8K0VYN7_9PLEO|nr:hypothetical protein FB567DRAFT_523733 [Paraphoma chrysanthemicola]